MVSNLITAPTDAVISRPAGSNLDIVTTPDGTKRGVCNMVSLNALSYNDENGTNQIYIWNYQFVIASYLAVKHLNGGDGSIIEELKGLNETCNIQFGLEIIDTEYDPIVAGNRVLQRIGLENETSKPEQRDSFEFNPCTFLESTHDGDVASATGFITGLQGFTEVAGVAMQKSLNNKVNFPKFARTITAFGGPAEAFIQYISEKLNAKHLAILYLDNEDASSGASQIRIANRAKKKIQIAEVVLNSSWDNIPDVVTELETLGFNTILAILPDMSSGNLTDSLMEEAYKQGIAGNGTHTWIFSVFSRHLFWKPYVPGSTLHSAYRGSGMITHGALAGQKYEKLNEELMQLIDSPDDLQNMRLLFPGTNTTNDRGMSKFLKSDEFWFDLRHLQYQYEAAILSGIAACRAVDDDLFLDRDNFYQQMLETSFQGISGSIVLDSETGSRIPYSTVYSMINFPDLNETGAPDNEGGNAKEEFYFEVRVAGKFDAGKWKYDEDFVFNDGTTKYPLEIQQYDWENSEIYHRKVTLAIAWVFCLVPIVLALACAIWTGLNRKTRIVRASQAFFLYFILGGTIVLALSIAPNTFDLSTTNMHGMTIACNASLWLVVLGISIILSAFFSKTHRIVKIMKASESFKRIKITIWDAIVPMAILITCTCNFYFDGIVGLIF